jgi:hypothetical protein
MEASPGEGCGLQLLKPIRVVVHSALGDLVAHLAVAVCVEDGAHRAVNWELNKNSDDSELFYLHTLKNYTN